MGDGASQVNKLGRFSVEVSDRARGE